MPRVRYTAAGGHYRVAGVGFDPGDEREVDADLAAYLTDREAFETVDEGDESDADDGCPFCDDYAGDNVAQHASQAHPEAWADYQAEGA